MIDATAALAKMAETALAVPDLDSPTDLCTLLAALYYIDRTQAAGYFVDQASRVLDALLDGIQACTGVAVPHPRNYVWYLACRYGKMAAEASTPSKLDIIHAAFFSEFNEMFANDANVGLFRDLVEKLDYNEALFLAGLWTVTQNENKQAMGLTRSPNNDDYHTARSLLSKGELFVVVVIDEKPKIRVVSTPALGRFIEFVGVTAPPQEQRPLPEVQVQGASSRRGRSRGASRRSTAASSRS